MNGLGFHAGVILNLFFISSNLIAQSMLPHTPEKSFNSQTKLLGAIPPNTKNFALSNDGQQFAYIHVQDGKKWMVFNGEKGKPFDQIPEAVFSTDSHRFVYIGLNGDLLSPKARSFVMEKGRSEKPYQGSTFGLTFSPDGRTLAYFLSNSSKDPPLFWSAHLVVDGEVKSKTYLFNRSEIYFDRSGKHIAFIAHRKNPLLVIDDKETETQEGDLLYLGPNFARLFSIRGAHALIDRRESVYEVDATAAPVFSPDGKRIAYEGTARGAGPLYPKEFVILNDGQGEKAEKEYSFISKTTFSHDSKKLAYVAWFQSPADPGPDPRRTVVLDGQEGKSYSSISGLTFSPDNKRLVYFAQLQGNNFIVLDGKETETPFHSVAIPTNEMFPRLFSSPTHFVFSPSGQDVAFLSPSIPPVKGQQWKRLPGGGLEPFTAPASKVRVILNNRPGKEYDQIRNLQFSPDGKYIAYNAQDGEQLWWIVEKL